MTYDLTTYAGGSPDLLEMRLNILDPYVDIFVIGEAEITFSGKAKPLYFSSQSKRFQKFLPKIRYVVVKNFYSPYIIKYMAKQLDMVKESYPHMMAFYQKEHLQAGMEDSKPDDVIYYGDCDEIWTPQQVSDTPAKLEQLSYAMYLNRRSSEPWTGTIVSTATKVKELGLNQIRLKAPVTLPNGGWHFTNVGGLDRIKRKLDSYDHQEVNTPATHAKLAERYAKSEDFLGRDFTMTTDESDWPQFLKDNRERYEHLLWL